MRVLLIEDDRSTAKAIQLMLGSEGFTVDIAGSGEDGIEIAKLHHYDIIILDLMLPDIDGHGVIRRLRVARVQTPILILSGLNEADVKVRGLDLGADDYLTKPFNKAEMFARIQAIARRAQSFPESNMRFGRLQLNLDAREADIEGTPLHLTTKEYEILKLLALRKDQVVTKEMILNHLYSGRDEPGAKIIDVFICKLRQKLAAASGGENYIETVWGRGFAIREPTEVAEGAHSNNR